MTPVAGRCVRAAWAALLLVSLGAAGILTGNPAAGATVTQHPPTLSGLAPATGVAGTAVVLTGTHLATETAVHFGTVKVSSVTYKGDDKLRVVAPTGKGTVAVSVTTPTGVSNPEPFTYDPPALTGLTPASGIAGTSVVLTGTHLSTETAVHFGKSKAASVTVKSPSKLIAIAPPGRGTVDVRVTAPTGTSNTQPFAYDAPTVTSLSRTKGVAGTPVTVHGTGFSPTAAVSFAGSPVTGATVKGPDTLTFVVPKVGTDRRKVDVVVRTPAGASSAVPFVFLPPAITITTSGLPAAITTQPYQGATLETSGGTSSDTWSAGSGFPRGLSLTPRTGQISGRVGTAGIYAFTVRVEDGEGAIATKSLSLDVTQGPFQIVTTSLPGASLDSPYSAGVANDADGLFGSIPPGLTLWSASGLPTGLRITRTWGTISGAPSASGTFPVIVTVENLWSGVRFATRTFTLVVQGFHITITRIAGFTSTLWQRSTTGPTALATATSTGPVRWSASGLPGGLVITAATGVISGTVGRGGATVGTHTFTATATDGAGATTSQSVTVDVTQGPLVMTTSGVGPAYLDTPYDGYLSAYGPFFPPQQGFTTWSASGLPAGLAITGVYGTIYGTPSASGTSHVTVTVDQQGLFFDVAAFTLNVSAFHIATSTLAGWTTNITGPTTSGATQLTAAGGTGTYTWSVGSGFPTGLTLIASSGTIKPVTVTGIRSAPVSAGTYTFTVTVRDGGGATASRSFSLTVTQGGFQVTSIGTQTVDENSRYGLTLSDNFGSLPLGAVLWFASGLPPGLTVTTAYGTITGTPTAQGAYKVTVRAFYAPSLWAARQFTIDVFAPLPTPQLSESTGRAGTVVKVTLGGIHPTLGVQINGTSCKVAGSDFETITLYGGPGSTAVTCTVPAGKGTVTLVPTTGASTFPGAPFAYSPAPGITQFQLVVTFTCIGNPDLCKYNGTVTTLTATGGFAFPGTVVHIRGSGFAGVTHVQVGATSVVPTSVTTTAIAIVAPALNGHIGVKVTNGYGTSNTRDVTIAEQPTITYVVPQLNIEPGTTISIFGANFTPTTQAILWLSTTHACKLKVTVKSSTTLVINAGYGCTPVDGFMADGARSLVIFTPPYGNAEVQLTLVTPYNTLKPTTYTPEKRSPTNPTGLCLGQALVGATGTTGYYDLFGTTTYEHKGVVTPSCLIP